jgi:hypothetical protein
MNEQLEKIVAIVNKLAPPSTLAIAIACGTVIFMPKELATTLGVEQFRESNKGFLGWSLIVCTSYLVAAAVWNFKSKILEKTKSYFVTKKYTRYLHELTNDEKKLLQRFIDGEHGRFHFSLILGFIRPCG